MSYLTDRYNLRLIDEANGVAVCNESVEEGARDTVDFKNMFITTTRTVTVPNKHSKIELKLVEGELGFYMDDGKFLSLPRRMQELFQGWIARRVTDDDS